MGEDPAECVWRVGLWLLMSAMVGALIWPVLDEEPCSIEVTIE